VRSRPILLRQDNQATTHSLANPVKDGKMKYLEIHFQFEREQVARREFEVDWDNSSCMLVDLLTKAHGPQKLKEMCMLIGLVVYGKMGQLGTVREQGECEGRAFGGSSTCMPGIVAGSSEVALLARACSCYKQVSWFR
jgi:hypothetical protein